MKLAVEVGGRTYGAEVHEEAEGSYRVVVDGEEFVVRVGDGAPAAAGPVKRDPSPSPVASTTASTSTSTLSKEGVRAPMPGAIVAVAVRPGQAVRKGEELLTMETMKMNVPVYSPRDGSVAAVHVAPGEAVRTGQPLLDLT